MGDAAPLTPRQIWAQPTASTTKAYQPGCSPVVLPSDGKLDLLTRTQRGSNQLMCPLGYVHLNRSYTLTLTQNAIFEPICTGEPADLSRTSSVLDSRDPFYSSTTPQLYAIGCATVVSYLLVVILFITPRTFYVGGPGGGANFLGRHGMISGSYRGNSSVVGVGGRPWLQKVAATLVAIALTIASVDSFRVAEQQYNMGYSDAESLSAEVIDGLEIRVVRVISSTFLWLAQVQTLIRLFPRHKEKIMIKWAGFALIVLDTIFAILDNFFVKANGTQPRMYDDAIPALSYLFELSLNLLYAAWVIFYALSKRRFAFFHPRMRNICLVALLSLCAVLIPVVFFVLDISKPNIAGWGSYIRWVGSAAASVVVWEWVERIEALERDERKGGILGREVFDGDEMLEVTPSEEVDWPRQPPDHDRGGGTGMSSGWGGMIGLGNRPLRTRVGFQRGRRGRRPALQNQNNASHNEAICRGAVRPTPPPTVATPISRDNTTSAGSTVYNVRYHPVSTPTPPVPMPQMEEEREDGIKELPVVSEGLGWSGHGLPVHQTEQPHPSIRPGQRWRSLLDPFRRRRASLPMEVAFAQAEEQLSLNEVSDSPNEGGSVQRTRAQVDYLLPSDPRRQHVSGRQGDDLPLPVTVIPARHGGQHTWTPQWNEDSNPVEQRQNRQPLARNSGLPVRVIPQQARVAAPWTGPDGDTDFGHNNYELRYDPDAAALVGPDDEHFADSGLVNHVRDYSVDQSSSTSAPDEDEEPDTPTGHPHEPARPSAQPQQPVDSVASTAQGGRPDSQQ